MAASTNWQGILPDRAVRTGGPITERGHLSALRRWLGAWPGVRVTPKAGGATFTVRGKIFAFTRPEGIAMKLPESRIHALKEERDAAFLVMGKRRMREWMVLRLNDGSIEKRDLDLLREARDCVAGS